MGHIIRVGDDWSDERCETLLDHLVEQGFGDSIIVRDSEIQVFEYNDLEDVTVYEDDIAEELGIEDTDDVKFLDNNTLEHGME